MIRRTALIPLTSFAVAAAAPPGPIALTGAEVRWADRFGAERTDWANSFVELGNGTLVVAGFVNRDDSSKLQDWDAILRSYTASGRLLWSQQIGGKDLDAAWSVDPLPDGHFALAGFSATGSAGGLDASLTLTDATGRVVAEKRFGGTGDDRATDLVRLVGGDFLLVGQSDSAGTAGIDVFLVRTDNQGKERWRVTHGTAVDDRGFYGLPMPDGGAIIAGVTGPRGSYDFLLMRVDRDGREVWRRTAGGPGNDATHGLAALPDGRVVHAGYGPSWGGRDNDVSLMTYSPDGTLLSHQAIGGPGDDRVQSIAVAPDRSVWLTGYTKSFSDEWRLMVARMDPNGVIEPWMAALAGPGSTNGSTISLTRDGDLLLGGYAVPSAGAAPDAFVARIDPTKLVRRTAGVEVRHVPVEAAPAR